jgi:2'-5' RNA ligase
MRTFIAVDLPEDVRAALEREQKRLRAACALSHDIRWTRPEGLHLTLKFLGEVAAERVAAIVGALESIGPFGKFEVEVRGFGFFPNPRRPRVFWVGLQAPAALGELAAKVEAAMAPLGFPPENRPFQPHLTLARFESEHAQPALEAALEPSNGGALGRFEVSAFFLFESKLRPGGAQYSKLARFPPTADQHEMSAGPPRPDGSAP